MCLGVGQKVKMRTGGVCLQVGQKAKRRRTGGKPLHVHENFKLWSIN